MLISYVMPAYNPPKGFLERAVQSVLHQTDERWELCICDDGSPDPVQPYENEKIKLVRMPHRGICEATNAAIDQASGMFCGVLDQDDWLDPEATAYVMACIAEHPEADIIYTDRYGWSRPTWNWEEHGLDVRMVVIAHLYLYRTSFLRALGGLDRRYEGAQDGDLHRRAVEAGAHIVHIPKSLYHWTHHADNFSNISVRDLSKQSCAAATERRRFGVPIPLANR